MYLLSRCGLCLAGGGEALRSESESETGLRGLEAEDDGRELVQFWSTGEERGLGRVDIPEGRVDIPERALREQEKKQN